MPGDPQSSAARPQGMHRTRAVISGERDIGVSMRPDVLVHKKSDGRRSDGRYCYWEFGRPINVTVRRLWVASGGRWRGYFEIHATDAWDGDRAELDFYSDSWHEVDGGPRTPFQGFTYNVPGAS